MQRRALDTRCIPQPVHRSPTIHGDYNMGWKYVLTAAALLAAALPAKATIILSGDGTPAGAFVDVKGFGFGDIHRLLTLQTNGTESGAVVPFNTPTGDAVPGADKASTPTLGALGWTCNTCVGMFFDADQTGQSGITLQSLTVSIYNATGTTILGSFSTAAPIVFTAADLALEPGNGEGGFFFSLTPAEQAQFAALIAMPGSSNFVVSTSATLIGANDGPDSFNAVSLAAVPGPIAGAGLPGLLAACVGLWGLVRRRRQQIV
jgi:hypothetical protein